MASDILPARMMAAIIQLRPRNSEFENHRFIDVAYF